VCALWEGGPCEVSRWLTSPAHEIPSQTGMTELPYIILHLTRAEAGTEIESLGLRYKGKRFPAFPYLNTRFLSSRVRGQDWIKALGVYLGHIQEFGSPSDLCDRHYFTRRGPTLCDRLYFTRRLSYLSTADIILEGGCIT
jgi:hypothetical protein